MPNRNGFFLLPLACLCLLYLAYEFFFNQYAMISVDEFWFAHRIYEYKDGMPYRDFAPYKTILGYYLLLLPMLAAKGVMSTLVLTKNAIAVLNTLVLFVSSIWLSRYIPKKGVLCGVAAVICMEIMLSYSSQIRVDLLAYWFCLFSFLCLLGRRFVLAGILLGLGFATSQKAIWYFFASNVALGTHWLLSGRSRELFIQSIKFNTSCFAVMAGYLLIWSAVADWHTIYNSVFVEASAMYHLDWYNLSRSYYWRMILLFNPLTFLLWPLTFVSLLVTHKNDHHYEIRRFAVFYAGTILFCLLPYKQVFPYYMQATLPAFLVLYSAFFSWMIDIFTTKEKLKVESKKLIAGFLALYSVIVAGIILDMHLPYAYLLMLVIPAALGYRTLRTKKLTVPELHLSRQFAVISIVLIGMAYPLTVYMAKVINLNGSYQRANLAAMNSLLTDGSDYTAGIELIYNKKQPIAGLRHLMGPAINYLYHPDKKLLPVMTASLYEDPNATIASVNRALKESNVKFYVNNYRMNALPKPIKKYLDSQYAHLWGSIYLYAPTVKPGKQQIPIKFTGEYAIDTSDNGPIIIDGKTFKKGDHIILQNRVVETDAKSSFRLRLVPRDRNLKLHPKYQSDEWERIIF